MESFAKICLWTMAGGTSLLIIGMLGMLVVLCVEAATK